MMFNYNDTWSLNTLNNLTYWGDSLRGLMLSYSIISRTSQSYINLHLQYYLNKVGLPDKNRYCFWPKVPCQWPMSRGQHSPNQVPMTKQRADNPRPWIWWSLNSNDSGNRVRNVFTQLTDGADFCMSAFICTTASNLQLRITRFGVHTFKSSQSLYMYTYLGLWLRQPVNTLTSRIRLYQSVSINSLFT